MDPKIPKENRLTLTFNRNYFDKDGGGVIVIKFGDEFIGEVLVTATEILKDRETEPHYLLRAVQRTLFHYLDSRLTVQIKKFKEPTEEEKKKKKKRKELPLATYDYQDQLMSVEDDGSDQQGDIDDDQKVNAQLDKVLTQDKTLIFSPNADAVDQKLRQKNKIFRIYVSI